MKKFYRNGSDSIISGICGSLGLYTNIDPLIWRLLFVGLVFTPFPIVFLYIVTALITKKIQYTD